MAAILCEFAFDGGGRCACIHCGFRPKPGPSPCAAHVRRCRPERQDAKAQRRKDTERKPCDVALLAAILRPGDLLAWVICAAVNVAPSACDCSRRRLQMNAWGWIGSFRRRQVIYGWLKEAAAREGVVVASATLRSLFAAGWRVWRVQPFPRKQGPLANPENGAGGGE